MTETKFKNAISNTLNVYNLRKIAGQTTFERGESYFRQGRVVSLLERESEFMHYLNSIRVTHKAKRNLMKLL